MVYAQATFVRKATTLTSPNGSYGFLGSPTHWQITQDTNINQVAAGAEIVYFGRYIIDWSVILESGAKGIIGFAINNTSPGGGDLHAIGPVVNLAAAVGSGSETLNLGPGDVVSLYGYGDGGAMALQDADSVHWGITMVEYLGGPIE